MGKLRQNERKGGNCQRNFSFKRFSTRVHQFVSVFSLSVYNKKKLKISIKRKFRVRECIAESERLFSFPKNEEDLQKWVENLKIPPPLDLPAHNAFVCIKHFERSAVGVRKLKAHAVPTLNLGKFFFFQ